MKKKSSIFLFKIILQVVLCLYVTSCTYNMCIQGNCYNGRGTHIWANGEKYAGEWRYGKRHGWGMNIWANGDKYEGEFRDDKMHGHGTFTWHNGDSLSAEWQLGYPNGQAVWRIKSGDLYQGEIIGLLREGGGWRFRLHGQGTYTWANGDKYEGEFIDGKKNGWGTHTFFDGTILSGVWKNDELVKSSDEVFEKYSRTEKEFREYFEANLSFLDPIEGIWSVNYIILNSQGEEESEKNNQVIVAIKKDTINLERDYIEIVLSSEIGFTPQTITAHFNKTAYSDVYLSRQLSESGTTEMYNFTIDNYGVLRSNSKKIGTTEFYNQIYYIKLFPPYAHSEQSFAESNPLKARLQPKTPSEIFAENNEAVVFIKSFDKSGNLDGFGSGFNVDKVGVIFTNLHTVISGGSYLRVEFQKHGTYKDVYIAGLSDLSTDLAVLRIDSKDLPCVNISPSVPVEVGDRIYTISNPEGLVNSLSEGLVSSIREIDNTLFYQITAPISEGSSGGAVFNEFGEVIGVATMAIKEGQNLNFAIAIDEFSKVEEFEKYFTLKELVDYLESIEK